MAGAEPAQRRASDSLFQLGLAGVLALLGVVSWLVTRWRVEDDDLRIETGLRDQIPAHLSRNAGTATADALRPRIGLSLILSLS